MFIAEEKKKENIAEYVLYMWQIEDMIRGFKFDINAIDKEIISKTQINDSLKIKLKQWYIDLITEMQKYNLDEKGHVAEVQEVINEMQYLMQMLLNVTKDEKFIKFYESTKDALKEYGTVSGKADANDVEKAFSALYSKLILKLKGQDISAETEEYMAKFSKLLAYLSLKYKEMITGVAVTPSLN